MSFDVKYPMRFYFKAGVCSMLHWTFPILREAKYLDPNKNHGIKIWEWRNKRFMLDEMLAKGFKIFHIFGIWKSLGTNVFNLRNLKLTATMFCLFSYGGKSEIILLWSHELEKKIKKILLKTTFPSRVKVIIVCNPLLVVGWK